MQFLITLFINILLGLVKKAFWEWPRLFGIESSSRLGKTIFWVQLFLLLALLVMLGLG